jgi:hypothetical protein
MSLCKRGGFVGACWLIAALAIAAPAIAGPILGSADISLDSSTLLALGFSDPLQDLGVVATTGQEICIPGDTVNTLCPADHPATNIGGDGSGGSTPMLPGEYIDLQTTSIVVSLANGDPDSTHTGYASGSYYAFDNIVFIDSITLLPVSGSIAAVTLGLDNVSGISVGSGVTFGPHSVHLDIDALNIGTVAGSGALGTVTLNLGFRPDVVPPNPAPEPGSLALFTAAMLALVAMRTLACHRPSRARARS